MTNEFISHQLMILLNFSSAICTHLPISNYGIIPPENKIEGKSFQLSYCTIHVGYIIDHLFVIFYLRLERIEIDVAAGIALLGRDTTKHLIGLIGQSYILSVVSLFFSFMNESLICGQYMSTEGI